MRILFIGDIVGKIGREAIANYLPKLKQTYKPTVTIVNAKTQHMVKVWLKKYTNLY